MGQDPRCNTQFHLSILDTFFRILWPDPDRPSDFEEPSGWHKGYKDILARYER